ncbi:MAG: 50S ribosomal protein L23 [Patescibacteria group bacterium]|nr:50S ribosomal protein L23 [Patescibacteria group bacterium]
MTIIKKPWVTEKSGYGTAGGKYTFMVQSGATKPEIRKAVKEIYKVDVVDVNVVNRPPKQKKFRGVRGGFQEGYRKAIVTLKEGQKIDIQ